MGTETGTVEKPFGTGTGTGTKTKWHGSATLVNGRAARGAEQWMGDIPAPTYLLNSEQTDPDLARRDKILMIWRIRTVQYK